MKAKVSLIALGMIPYYAWTSSDISPPFLMTSTTDSGPSIEYVLPVPLIPYAKIVPLKPSVNYFTVSYAQSWYI